MLLFFFNDAILLKSVCHGLVIHGLVDRTNSDSREINPLQWIAWIVHYQSGGPFDELIPGRNVHEEYDRGCKYQEEGPADPANGNNDKSFKLQMIEKKRVVIV